MINCSLLYLLVSYLTRTMQYNIYYLVEIGVYLDNCGGDTEFQPIS